MRRQGIVVRDEKVYVLKESLYYCIARYSQVCHIVASQGIRFAYLKGDVYRFILRDIRNGYCQLAMSMR
jgi:hypothetical protein